MSAAPNAPGALDDLCQIRDELRVVWLALTSPEASEHTGRIAEHVNGLANRLDNASERLASEARR